MNQRKSWYVMDYLKFFFCLCIIGIHVEVFQSFASIYYWIEKGVFRIGVPFFMIASGFLLGSKLYSDKAEGHKEKVKPILITFSKRLLKMLLIFEPISIILNSIIWGLSGTELLSIVLRSVRSVVFYPLGALWYIQAILIGVWIAYYFIIKKKIWLGLIIGGCLYIIALLCNSYYFLVEGTFL